MIKGFSVLISLLPLVAFAYDNYDVQVGKDGLTYTPDRLFGVKPGDTVTFKFNPKNHTVTQSSFDTPCKKLDWGKDSDFRPVSEGVWAEDFVFNVESWDPVWFYCRQKGHCNAGMVFALNAHDDYQVDQFQQNAKNTPTEDPTTTTVTYPEETTTYDYWPQPSDTPVDHQVEVGLNGLTFSPPFISANLYDTVTFVFHPKNHTATQSTFDQPCVKKGDSFDSGFQPVDISSPLKKWTVTVNDTNPIWVYCKQRNGNHCGNGMVFAINSDESGDKSFAKFQENAKRINGTVSTTTAPTGSGTGKPPSPSSTVTGANGSMRNVYVSGMTVLAVAIGATLGVTF